MNTLDLVADLTVPIKDAVFGYIDLETTGIFLMEDGPNRVVELGAALMDHQGKLLDSFRSLVNPQRPIPAVATDVHAICDSDVAEAPAWPEAWPLLHAFLDRATILFGFHSPFDLRFIVHELLLAGEEPPHMEFFDVARMAARAGHGRVSLEGLAVGLNAGREGAHSALGDAIMTGSCMSSLLSRAFATDQTIAAVRVSHDANVPVYDTGRCLPGVQASHLRRRADRLPRVCVTGKLEGMLRKEVKERLASVGFKYVKEASKQPEFVVVGERPADRKVEDAMRLHVPILDGQRFMSWLEARERQEDATWEER